MVRQEKVLYLGRLDNLTEPDRIRMEQKLKELNEPKLLKTFRSLLYSLGYEFPSDVSLLEVDEVYSYGVELALHKVCEEIGLVDVINRHGYKGGGPELGKVAEAMAINRNCEPCSCLQLVDWYSRSSLPIFLKLPPAELTYWVVLRALDYLQPQQTLPMQIELYKNIQQVYRYTCNRLDIDITTTYFEGEKCVLAKFGHSRDHRPDRLQIVVAFVVDQKGVMVTHQVWPGNRTDVKSLKPVDRTLNIEFGLDAPRVIDRGMATWENLRYMDRKKERYLVALRAEVKSTGFLEDIPIPQEKWADVGEGEVATSVIKGRRKYVVVWNASVAEINRREREGRVKNAEEKLKNLLSSVKKGDVTSRQERDERAGHIIREHKVTRFLRIKSERKGYGFTIVRLPGLDDAARYDGYQIFVTTEVHLSEKEVVEAYRARDQIEKAIRALKNVMGLHPMWVWTESHIKGMIFVDALAYQIRSILRMKIKDHNIEMSIEEAMKTLERLKAVHIVVKDEEIQVHRKLTRVDDKIRMLIEVFNMKEDGRMPGVDGGI
jgi:transposase